MMSREAFTPFLSCRRFRGVVHVHEYLMTTITQLVTLTLSICSGERIHSSYYNALQPSVNRFH